LKRRLGATFSTHWWASVGDCDTEQCEAAVIGSAFSRSALAPLAAKIAPERRLPASKRLEAGRPAKSSSTAEL
jgi:hypothetical protein